MTDAGEPLAQPSLGPWQRRKARVQQFALLVAVVLASLGLFWIWEEKRSETFSVRLELEPDGLGLLSMYPFDAESLFVHMDYRIELKNGGVEVAVIPEQGEERAWRFTVSGAADRKEVKEGHFRGVLHWRGADPDRLKIELAKDADSQAPSFSQTLSVDQIRDFYMETTLAVFRIVDDTTQSPLVQLSSYNGELETIEDVDKGLYSLKLSNSELLRSIAEGQENVPLPLAYSERREGIKPQRFDGTVAVPVAWFLRAEGEGAGTRVLSFAVRLDTDCPKPTSVSPTSVTCGDWGGRLVVEGRFLDVIDSAYLERAGRRVVCEVERPRGNRVDLVVPGDVEIGKHAVYVKRGDCGAVLAGDLQVSGGLIWRYPLPDAAVRQGDALRLLWAAACYDGPVTLDIEGLDHPSTARLAEVSAGIEEFMWSKVNVEPGTYALRLQGEGQGGLSATVNVRVEPAKDAPVLVVLNFKENGKPWRIAEAKINGKTIPKDEWQSNEWSARLALTVGAHRWSARGRNGREHAGTFNVSEQNVWRDDGEFEPIVLGNQ